MSASQAHCLSYAKQDDNKAYMSLFITACIEFVAFVCIHTYFSFFGWTIHTLNIVRLFVQFHDMGHYSFFKTVKLNRIFGEAIGVYMIFPFSAWRDGHNHHHATFGLIDIDTSQTILFTKKDYEGFSLPFKCFVRVVREPIVFFLVTVPVLWIFGTLAEYIWNRKYFVGSMKLLGFGLFYLFASNTFIFCHYISIVIGTILFHLQHSVNAPYRAREANWVKNDANLEGSTYLRIPFFLKLFTNGIEYHHIHHINPLVPSYSIRECHETFTWDRVNSVNYSQALNSLTNVMLDEDKNRLVGF